MEFTKEKLAHLKSTLTVKAKKLDDGVFEAVLTTGDLDRHGEIVSAKGIQIPKNQVIKMYYNHETNGTSLPIGKWLSIWKSGDKVMGRGEIDMDDPFAVMVYNKILKGYIDSISIGFYPLEYDGETKTWTASTLVEASVVAEPANVNAVITNKDMGMTTSEFKQLLRVRVKESPEILPLPEEVEPLEEIDEDERVPVKRLVKGAVEDVLLAPKKWELMRPYYDVMCAFEEAYYDEDTDPADFSKLLNETIGLLKQIADGTYDTTKSASETSGTSDTEIKAAFELLKSNYGSLEAAVKAADEKPAMHNIIKIRLAGKQVDKAVEALNSTLKVKLKETN